MYLDPIVAEDHADRTILKDRGDYDMTFSSLVADPGKGDHSGQLGRVIGSIKQFGIVLPILIDSRDRIVAGHSVWDAAGRLGLETIECRIVDHLDEVELEALTLVLCGLPQPPHISIGCICSDSALA